MAKQLENDKGFLILKVDKKDMDAINSPGICDWCACNMDSGKYIAAMNKIYCDKCYDEWCERAIYYPEDSPIEKKNFKYYSHLFRSAEDYPQLNI